ncbi:MAG TPA: hypothetical protein VFM14_14195 [Gemmatimonadales bacterium]|nr:hypothetical protein [Gemmatimonadales bacterium]
MARRACPHCVMPLGLFAVACPRCGRPTPLARTLPWLGAGVIGLVVLAAFAVIAWTRIGERAPKREGPVPDSVLTLPPAPPRGMVAALDSAEAAHESSAPARPDTTPKARRVPNIPDTSGIEVNAYPPDRNALDGIGPGERRRSTLDALLRRGLADSVVDRPPRTVQVFVGRAFFRQPRQFRNPLIKALDVAWQDQLGNSRTFELWWDTFRIGSYSRDTFHFTKWYYELR